MKKLLLLTLVSFFTATQFVFSTPQTSNNSFEIPIDSVPSGGSSGSSGKSGGLSGGAVTAITLGSVFGGAAVLGGLGWLAKKKGGLACGYACGFENPYSTITIPDCATLEKLKRGCCNDKYSIKAFEYIKSARDSSNRYLIVKDINIEKNTYNIIFFDLPDSKRFNKLKIIQVSEPYTIKDKLPSLESKIVLNPRSESSYEIPTTVIMNHSHNGILIKHGILKAVDNKTAALVTENRTNSQMVYSVIVEFSD